MIGWDPTRMAPVHPEQTGPGFTSTFPALRRSSRRCRAGWAAPVVEKGDCAPPMAQTGCFGPDSRIYVRRLHDSKTELMLVTSKRSKHLHNLPTSITIGNAQIPFKQSVKNLGFTLDCHLTMNAHVSNIARTCYYELRRLASIRRFLTSTATATLVSAFVLSRIDYCNSLLFGSTNDVTSHLQRIQNYAARVIFRLPMSSSITIHLKSLHWLPVKVRSTYKIACLCYHCHSSTAPSYVTDMLHKKPLHTRNTRSISYTMPLLNRPAHSKATLGDRSFSFASSSVWNSIPNDVRCAPSLSSFKSRLKTYLFRSVYID